MNSPVITKDRGWRAHVSMLNGESSSSIAIGNVVCIKAAVPGSCVLPSSVGVTQAHSLFAGIAVSAASPGQSVEVIVAGYVATVKLHVRTRAASTDSYASVAARAVGNLLTIDTVNNCLAYSTVGAASLGLNPAVLMETLASVVSAASTTSDTGLVQTQNVKVWVRAMC
jgi:hypothetical protein